MSVGMVDAWLSKNKRGKSVVTVPFLTASLGVNSLATWSTVTQVFWVRILADLKIFTFGIALMVSEVIR